MKKSSLIDRRKFVKLGTLAAINDKYFKFDVYGK